MSAIQWLATLGVTLLLPAAHATTAIVFSESTGRYGVTWNEPNKKEAIEVATDYCRKMGGGKDCKPLRVTDELGYGAVANTCAGNFCGISVITGRRSATQAERDAIKDCNSYYGTNNCVVLDNWQETGAAAPVTKAPPYSPKPQQKPALAENKPASKANAPINSSSRSDNPKDEVFLAVALGHHRWGDDGLPIIGKGEQASVFYCTNTNADGTPVPDVKKCVEDKCKSAFPGEGKCKVTGTEKDDTCTYMVAYVGPPGDNEHIQSQVLCEKRNQHSAYNAFSKNGFPTKNGRKVLELINMPRKVYDRINNDYNNGYMGVFSEGVEGKWIEDDNYKIIDLIQAENGSARHQFYLSLLLGHWSTIDEGKKREPLLSEERWNRRRWLEKAAENGHADAQFDLGMEYIQFNMTSQQARSVEEKRGWLRKAAAQGHKAAQRELTKLGIKW